MKSNKEKVAVITGSSSGIGRELFIQLLGSYNKVFICGRNLDSLNELKNNYETNSIAVIPIEMDLGRSDSIKNAAGIILNQVDKIDLLINNAGISQRSLASVTSEVIERKLFEINYFGPVILTKMLLKGLRNSGHGKILVTSSIVGKFGFPLRSTYSAAKHALHGYFESLRIEEENNGLSIHLMVIGRVKTNISTNAITEDGSKYAKMDSGQASGISSNECAKKMIKAMNNNKKEALIGNKEILMVYFKRYIPFLFYKFARKEVNYA